MPVRSGVPYDLPYGITSNVRLFADDTALDRPIASTADVEALQKDLDTLSDWEQDGTWLSTLRNAPQ